MLSPESQSLELSITPHLRQGDDAHIPLGQNSMERATGHKIQQQGMHREELPGARCLPKLSAQDNSEQRGCTT